MDFSFDLQHNEISDTEKAFEPVTVTAREVVVVVVEVRTTASWLGRREVEALHRAIDEEGCWR